MMPVQHTVLIIDDNPLVRESFRDLLEAEAFSVAEASNGAEAILWFQRGTADMILLDLKMPVMDGRSFLEYRLRQTGMRRIPVLVVSSAPDDPGVRPVMLRLGADRLLQKPVRREELLHAMQGVLARPDTSAIPPPTEAQDNGVRQDARLSFNVPIRVRTHSSLGATGMLRDLSAGGLGVYLSRRLEPRETITVSLDVEGRSLALTGFVQWAAEDRTAMGFRHGIRFTEKQEDTFPLYTYSFFREHSGAPN
ncbi:MAG: response regulator [Candidatus Methylomirabilales bacterium]